MEGDARIEMGENRVHFEQTENSGGLLVKPFAGNLDGNTKRGFAAMNEALKARAEASERGEARLTEAFLVV